MRKNKGFTLVEVMVVMVIAVIVLGLVGLEIAGLGNKEVHTATVTGKESIRSGNGNKYLIFTEGEVFPRSIMLNALVDNPLNRARERKDSSRSWRNSRNLLPTSIVCSFFSAHIFSSFTNGI